MLLLCWVKCHSPSRSHNLRTHFTAITRMRNNAIKWWHVKMSVGLCVTVLTWAEETVEVSYDGSEWRSKCWLVVHAAVDQFSELRPLGSRYLVTVFIEQVFLKWGIQRHCSSKGPDYSFNSNSYYKRFLFIYIYCGSIMRTQVLLYLGTVHVGKRLFSSTANLP